MGMTLLQLQYYATVCKYKSFTKAAEELRISQPGISSAMKELEKECKVALFERRNNSLIITDEGVMFLEEAKKMLKQYEHLEKIVQNLSQGRGYVRIGLATMGGNAVYPKLRRRFQQEYPDIEVIASEDTVDALEQMLENDEIDIILCASSSLVDNTKYGHVIIRESRLLFCVSKDHPLALETSVSYERIGKEPLVMLTDNYNQTRSLKKRFKELGIEPVSIHYTNQAYTVVRFIKDGAAAGFLPSDIVEEDEGIVGFPLPDGNVSLISLLWKKDKIQFSAAQKFIDFTKKYCRKTNYGRSS